MSTDDEEHAAGVDLVDSGWGHGVSTLTQPTTQPAESEEESDTPALLQDLNDFDYSMPGYGDLGDDTGADRRRQEPNTYATGTGLDWDDNAPQLASSAPGVEDVGRGLDIESALIKEEESGGEATLDTMARADDVASESGDSVTDDVAQTLRQTGRKVSFAGRDQMRVFQKRGVGLPENDVIEDFWEGDEREEARLMLEDSSLTDLDSDEREGQSLLATGVDKSLNVLAKLPLNRFVGDFADAHDLTEMELDELNAVEDDVEAIFVRRRMGRFRRAWVVFRDERVIQLAVCVGCLMLAVFIGVLVYMTVFSDSAM